LALVNTNAITEANFKLQKDLMAGFTKNQFQSPHNLTIAHFKWKSTPCRFLLWNIWGKSFDLGSKD
jgi:hypothetical protein